MFTFSMHMRTADPVYLNFLPFWWAESADLRINTIMIKDEFVAFF